MLPSFDFHVASTLEQAFALFGEQPGARYLAGGTDLLPQLRAGRRQAACLIDIKRIPELNGVHAASGQGLRIGAATSMADVARDSRVRERFPMLVACCDEVGAYPLRHRATIAGNACNASPAADTAIALLCLDAVMVVARPGGTRQVPANEFFRGPGKTVLEPGELLTEIELPEASVGFQAKYLRLSRRKGMDLATIGVLVAHRPSIDWRVALAAVAPVPMRVREAEALLSREGAGVAERAADIARDACSPIDDIRGSADYRREMARVLVARGIRELA